MLTQAEESGECKNLSFGEAAPLKAAMRRRRRQANLVDTWKSGNGQVRTRDAERGRRSTEGTKEKYRLHQQGILFSSLTSHGGNFIHFIVPLNYKSCTVHFKSSFTRPGKPLLYGWGGLFRGRKSKGTYFQGTPLLTFCWVHTPQQIALAQGENMTCVPWKEWNSGWLGVKRAGF